MRQRERAASIRGTASGPIPFGRSRAIDRRGALLGLGALAMGAACRRPDPPPASSPAWREIAFDPEGDGEPQRATLFAPEGARELPLLVALHGRGETRSLAIGARAWRDDYGIERTHRCLLDAPIDANDLLGMTTDERLARINASLARAPYRGLRLACPFTPDLLRATPESGAGFARFVIDRLLPWAARESGAPVDRKRTGIDGVSLDGRLALLVGFSHPEAFGAIGALQPAIRTHEASLFAGLAKQARRRAAFALRFVSSEDDPFLEPIRALSARLHEANVEHELLVVTGPHDYAWNRGPGGAEMLLWHERVLRGLPPP